MRVFIKTFIITVILGAVICSAVGVFAVLGFFGNLDDLDVKALTMNYSTQICYIDENGSEKELTTLSAEQNRVWVDYDEIPENMKKAIVAIEDERFYTHKGFDARRTFKAFCVFIKNKVTRQPTTFGGSTITQQLIKNLTQKTERTPARKIQEISRAVNLEKQLSKEKILELYLNSIYLSQGCSGVQTASQKFFGKPVSELDLAECASIAGITQYPSLYDPLTNPDKNKEKQEIVLKKMLELGDISNEEYESAVNEKLVFAEYDESTAETGIINSYFVDQIVYDVLDALTEKGYSKTLANKMIYSGGLKIVATVNPKIQQAMEEVFTNTKNFPYATGENHAQASMAVIDPYTGEVKGLVGGVGKKTGNLVLNRATQTLRQPGSTIKPIGVYAPAIENHVINASDIYVDKAISYGNWTPHNYDRRFHGAVSVRYAVKQSLNTIPVQILDEMGANRSFNFLTQKLGLTSLVRSETGADGKEYSDIGLSQLALGGLTHGVSVLELTSAYAPFINRGIYSQPHTFTVVKDAEGKEILSNESTSEIAMSESTAYIISMMLREVVTAGTGRGSQVSSGIFTAGKTGTTSDNNDRWFVGYTPYYAAAVWYGYDTPQPIKASGNPCVPIWRSVMSKIHEGLSAKAPEMPSNVKYITYCSQSGKLPGKYCEGELTSFWFTADNQPKGICSNTHGFEEKEETPKEGENVIDTDNVAGGENGAEEGKTGEEAPANPENGAEQSGTEAAL